jgi:hypothetical protein
MPTCTTLKYVYAYVVGQSTLCKFLMNHVAMLQACYSLPDWDWDEVFLDKDGGNFIEQGLDICA